MTKWGKAVIDHEEYICLDCGELSGHKKGCPQLDSAGVKPMSLPSWDELVNSTQKDGQPTTFRLLVKASPKVAWGAAERNGLSPLLAYRRPKGSMSVVLVKNQQGAIKKIDEWHRDSSCHQLTKRGFPIGALYFYSSS